MPTPDNIRDDAEAVLRYCRVDLGLKGKMGVYGRSLGGIASTHLAQYTDMVIVDRSFSNLYEVALHKFYGYLAVMLFRLGTLGWDSNNDVRYIECGGADKHQKQADMLQKGFFPVEESAQYNSVPHDSHEDYESPAREGREISKCYKVITCDANDDIVVLQGSLMIGVARKVATAHQQKTDHYRDKPLGILDKAECEELIRVMDSLQETEDRLFSYVKTRIDYENKSRELRKQIPAAEEDLEAHEISENIFHSSNAGQRLVDKLSRSAPNHLTSKNDDTLTAHTSMSHLKAQNLPQRETYKQTQVLDLNQALSVVQVEQIKQDRALLEQTNKKFKPVLKKVPQMQLYAESDKLFLRDDYQPINTDLIELQIVLSKVLQEVMSLKAANITLKDILNYNTKKTALEVQNFFLLQEVFGFQYAVNFFEPSITPLSMQRRKARKDLMLLQLRLKEYIERLDNVTRDPQAAFGYIYQDLLSLAKIIGRVSDYFKAKTDILVPSQELEAKGDLPLFKTMGEPAEDLVGHLIDLKCGHTQRPSDLESVMFTVHLEAAGFMKGKGAVGSPQRSVLNSIQGSPANSVTSLSQSKQRKSLTLIKVKTPFPTVGSSGSGLIQRKQRQRANTIPDPKSSEQLDKDPNASASNDENRPSTTRNDGMTSSKLLTRDIKVTLKFDSEDQLQHHRSQEKSPTITIQDPLAPMKVQEPALSVQAEQNTIDKDCLQLQAILKANMRNEESTERIEATAVQDMRQETEEVGEQPIVTSSSPNERNLQQPLQSASTLQRSGEVQPSAFYPNRNEDALQTDPNQEETRNSKENLLVDMSSKELAKIRDKSVTQVQLGEEETTTVVGGEVLEEQKVEQSATPNTNHLD